MAQGDGRAGDCTPGKLAVARADIEKELGNLRVAKGELRGVAPDHAEYEKRLKKFNGARDQALTLIQRCAQDCPESVDSGTYSKFERWATPPPAPPAEPS
jgi:hypothetical protein